MSIQELLNKNDRFAAAAGCQITEVDEQHAVAVMTVTNTHLNGGNVCQGGAHCCLDERAGTAHLRHPQQHHVCVERQGGRRADRYSHQRLQSPQDSHRRGRRYQSGGPDHLPRYRHGLQEERAVAYGVNS